MVGKMWLRTPPSRGVASEEAGKQSFGFVLIFILRRLGWAGPPRAVVTVLLPVVLPGGPGPPGPMSRSHGGSPARTALLAKRQQELPSEESKTCHAISPRFWRNSVVKTYVVLPESWIYF